MSYKLNLSLNLEVISCRMYQGCHSFFQIFLQVFQISSRFLRVHIFGSIFNLKLILRLETVLNSIKTLKRYCKANLNMFFNEKKFDNDKKFINMIEFRFKPKFYNWTCENFPNSRFFFKISQFRGLSRFFFA